jgi:hypothetical protein
MNIVKHSMPCQAPRRDGVNRNHARVPREVYVNHSCKLAWCVCLCVVLTVVVIVLFVRRLLRRYPTTTSSSCEAWRARCPPVDEWWFVCGAVDRVFCRSLR